MRLSKILAKIRAGKVPRVCSTGIPPIYMPQMADRARNQTSLPADEYLGFNSKPCSKNIF